MKLFKRLLGKATADPEFGIVEFDDLNNSWTASVHWPYPDRAVPVTLFRAPDKPNDNDRNAFRALKEKYNALTPAIQSALFKLYGTPPPGMPKTSHAQALWSLLSVQGLAIEESSRIELFFGFNDHRFVDALFRVAVHGINVEGVSFETD